MTEPSMQTKDRPSKRLIVCCDGTWNDADNQSADTNVFRIARSIHATQGTDVQQIVLYLRGVGTAGLKTEQWIEGATGLGIDDNILSAYMFIAQNYIPGDEIFLFGFSRGAFTARSLVGMISACGILKRQRLGDLPHAFAYYHSPRPHDPASFIAQYKTDAHVDTPIKFLGVWDTVGALGIPGHLFANQNEKLFGFHDTSPCALVKHACHALAIDEHRDAFVPTLWTGEAPQGCVIEQVWFAGAHADVGGGYITRKLADIPLLWMARKAEASGLHLDWTCLPDEKNLDARAPIHDSSSGLFTLDRIRSTWRQIAGKSFNVGLLERIYAPHDAQGNLLPTINQAIHASVVTRHGQLADTCASDETGSCEQVVYQPLNLTPFFVGSTGALMPGVPVAGENA